MVASLKFRPDDPRRPLDWRWQKAGEILDLAATLPQPPQLSRDHGDDDAVQAAVRFRRRAERTETEADQLELLRRSPSIYNAWNIWQDRSDQGLKWELEARLLANEDFKLIEKKTCVDAAAVCVFEQLFFNVLDRLESQSYVVHAVFRRSLIDGLRTREYDLLWKLYGYWGGSFLLDDLIYQFNAPIKPNGVDRVDAFWADDGTASIRRKNAIALRTLPVNSQTALEIINVHQQLLQIEKGAEIGGGEESYKKSVQALIEAMPFRRIASGQKKTTATLVQQVESYGATLRASELIELASGKVHEGLLPLLASAKFPEKTDETEKTD
jgi:hypothetical protein